LIGIAHATIGGLIRSLIEMRPSVHRPSMRSRSGTLQLDDRADRPDRTRSAATIAAAC
jgi:hypothetical protein